MPLIHSVQTILPPHHYDQETLIELLVEYWSRHYFNPQRIIDFQRNVLVGGRHLAVPVEKLRALKGFGAHNDAWIEAAVPLAEKAVSGAAAKAGLQLDDVGLIASTTVTGLAVPSLEARLMNRLPFSANTKRMPLFGLGCLGGAAGINRVADYLVGHPTEAAVMLSVELCSLTIQREDLSVANIISSGLFGDGCAAVVLVGDEHPLAASAPLRIFGLRSVFFPDTERVMAWDIVDSGFKVVLAPTVADIVAEHLPTELDRLLADEGIEKERPSFFVGHPGGPKILEATEAALGLPANALELSWNSLAEYGNMSSTSVLFVLADALRRPTPVGTLGLMFAFGPAFCAELALLRVVGACGEGIDAQEG